MNNRPDWAAVLFDLDGTLADSIELILSCYRHTMRVHLGEALPDERWLAGIGTPLRVQMRAFARDEAEAQAMVATYVALQETIHDGMVEPYPGVRAMLDTLRARGVPLGIVTSKRGEMAGRTLARCGLDDAFRVVVTAADVKNGKPDPEPVLLALDRLGVADQAARTLFVGDSPFDLRAGRVAGTRTGAALWGPFAHGELEDESPDYRLATPGEVIALRP